MTENKKTCLYDKHVALGALMSPFGGFDMPIQYAGIVEEHNAVRTAVGVFELSQGLLNGDAVGSEKRCAHTPDTLAQRARAATCSQHQN